MANWEHHVSNICNKLSKTSCTSGKTEALCTTQYIENIVLFISSVTQYSILNWGWANKTLLMNIETEL